MTFFAAAMVALLAGPVGSAGTADLTGPAYARAIEAEARALTDLSHFARPKDILGPGAKRFVPRNPFHHPGNLNDGLYRVPHAAGPRLIKFQKFTRDLSGDAYVLRRVAGQHLSTYLGGVTLHRAGLVDLGGGEKGFYVEVDEAFPAESRTFTWKGRFRPSRLRRWASARPLTDQHVRWLSENMVRLLERGITPVDLDAIFGADGARWIDADQWQTIGVDAWAEEREIKNALDRYGWFVESLYVENPNDGVKVLAAFGRAIARSRVWTSDERVQLIANLERGLSFKVWLPRDAARLRASCESSLLD